MDRSVLDTRLLFEAQPMTQGALGTSVGGFASQFTVWGRILHLRGGEAVVAERLAATSPAVITVLKNSLTVQIRSDWRAVHAGMVYELTEEPRKASEDPDFLDMMCRMRRAEDAL